VSCVSCFLSQTCFSRNVSLHDRLVRSCRLAFRTEPRVSVPTLCRKPRSARVQQVQQVVSMVASEAKTSLSLGTGKKDSSASRMTRTRSHRLPRPPTHTLSTIHRKQVTRRTKRRRKRKRRRSKTVIAVTAMAHRQVQVRILNLRRNPRRPSPQRSKLSIFMKRQKRRERSVE
jgi:hypothetical protein